MKVSKRITGMAGGIILIGVSGLILLETATFPASNTLWNDSALFPRLLAVLIIGLSGYQVVENIRGVSGDVQTITWPQVIRFGIVLWMIVVYISLLPYTGFLLTTAGLLFTLIKYSGVRSTALPAAVSALVPVVLFYVFGEFLRIRLPENAFVPLGDYLPQLPL